MSFDHESLEVYQLALDFIVLAADVVANLPRGRRHLVDQLNRASTSIVLNIAEGAGKYSRARVVAMLTRRAKNLEHPA